MDNVSLYQLCGDNWKEQFLDTEVISGILSAVNLKDLSFKEIAKRYEIDDDRVSLIVTLEDEDKHLEQAIIDIKTGFPTWEQLMDVTYTIGQDCERKIVIVDGEEKGGEYDLGIAYGFLEMLIGSRVNLDILMLDELVETPTGNKFSYKLIDKPRARDKKSSPLPSKWEALKMGFWVFHFISLLLSKDSPQNYPEASLDKPYWEHDTVFGFTPAWSDKGLFFHAVADSEAAVEIIRWIRKNRWKTMREHYKDYIVTLHKKKGAPHKISLKLPDKPIRDIVFSNEDEKWGYAGKLRDLFRELQIYITDLTMDMERDKLRYAQLEHEAITL